MVTHIQNLYSSKDHLIHHSS